jgi:hypothetical protein
MLRIIKKKGTAMICLKGIKQFVFLIPTSIQERIHFPRATIPRFPVYFLRSPPNIKGKKKPSNAAILTLFNSRHNATLQKQNSAQGINFFRLLHTETIHFQSSYILHFQTLCLASNLALLEEQAGTARNFGDLKLFLSL